MTYSFSVSNQNEIMKKVFPENELNGNVPNPTSNGNCGDRTSSTAGRVGVRDGTSVIVGQPDHDLVGG